LNLRENEIYTRYYHSLGKSAGYFVPNNGKDPEEANERYHLRGNGVRLFKPNLTAASLNGTITYIEVEPHALASAALGKSQQAVCHLLGTVIAETLVGFQRNSRRARLEHVVLCIDQSGSMATSVVYASIFGAVLASIPALATRLVAFDTAVLDLTEDLADPVDMLFGVQLARAAALVERGVNIIALLALSDAGKPASCEPTARRLAALGIPVFACTPDLFSDLMAAALRRQDIAAWAALLTYSFRARTIRSAP